MTTRIQQIRRLPSDFVTPMRAAWETIGPRIDDLDQALARLAPPGLQAHDLTGRLLDLRLALSTWSWRRYRLDGALKEVKDALLGSRGGPR